MAGEFVFLALFCPTTTQQSAHQKCEGEWRHEKDRVRKSGQKYCVVIRSVSEREVPQSGRTPRVAVTLRDFCNELYELYAFTLGKCTRLPHWAEE